MKSSTGKTIMEVSSKRSLRSLPLTNATSFVFSHGKNNCDQTFCTLYDGQYHVRRIPEMCGMKCEASCYGWLILIGYKTTDCHLFNPVTLVKIDLPQLPHKTFHAVVLTSPPNEPHCVVFLFSAKKQMCIFCRIGDTEWTEQEFTRDKEILERINPSTHFQAVGCKGKIYLFFPTCILVGDESTFAYVKTHDEFYPPQHSEPWISSHTNFYVESLGEIFRAFAIHSGYREEFVRFDVFKLDRSNMDWVKVESIGDRIFLLNDSSLSVSATELGVKGNRLYFSILGSTSLYRFDMEDGTITITIPYPRKFTRWCGPFWIAPNRKTKPSCRSQLVGVAPNCKPQVNKDVAKFRESKCGLEQEEIDSWKDLPIELLQLIFSSLFLGDCIRFRLTCKKWSSIVPSLRSNPTLLPSNSEALKLPWLISFPNINEGICNFHHPIYSDTYMMNIPQLAGAIIHDAKYGWLLMSRGEYSIFFFNPITEETIKLPDLENLYAFVGISFSSPPSCSDCIVYGHRPPFTTIVEMWVYRKAKVVGSSSGEGKSCKDTGPPHGDDEVCEATWCKYVFDMGRYEFQASFCNPVVLDGVFYMLDEDGKLGAFNTNETAQDLMWKILPVPSVVSSIFRMRSVIVECDGEIICVFMGSIGKPIWIYKLNETKTKWSRVKSLGDKVIFISYAASVMVRAGLKGIENRIYFSRFHGEDSLYYSLSTGRYHCFGSKYSREDWIDTRGPWACSWMQFTN